MLELWPQPLRRSEGLIETSARLEEPGGGSEVLWYRVPETCGDWLTDSLDPFVIGLVFAAMRRGMDLHAHGAVSPSLLRNLEEFQSAWQCWQPEQCQRVEIQAELEREDACASGDRAALMFSGGLDSCFTAWRHTQGLCGRRRRSLETALMVHGFDIPLVETAAFRRAAENSRALAGSVGLDLVPLASNFRDLEGDRWESTHGAALASCLHLFRRRFGTGLIAGSHVYRALRFPWGSNPLTDVLLSTRSLSIVYDGAEYSRREKARVVADWGEAMTRMRVCWEGEHKDANCGSCLRCVGTAICFAVERQPVPASLPIPSLEAAIDRLSLTNLKPVSVTRLGELLAAAHDADLREPWVKSLERCVRIHNGDVRPGWRRAAGSLGQRFLRWFQARPAPEPVLPPSGGRP